MRRLASAIGRRYSRIFVAALLAIGLVRITEVGPNGGDTRVLSLRVSDASSGAPLKGAKVALGEAATMTDGAGIARFRTGWQTQPVVMTVPG